MYRLDRQKVTFNLGRSPWNTELKFGNIAFSEFCHSGARRKVPTYLFLSLCFSVWEPNVPYVRTYVRPCVRGPTGRNFFSILDCEPILESISNYLEVLFSFFPSFYFLRT